MKCPRCGNNMSKDSEHTFCTHCGYLDNGEQIHGYEEKQASDLEIYLGKDFNKIWRNENCFTSFILGPLYLCYRGFILLGLLFMPLEWFFWAMMFGSFYHFRYVLLVIAILISRTIFMAVNNMICLYFYQRDIQRIKKRYPNNYLDKLREINGHTINSWGVFLVLFFFLMLSMYWIICYFFL